MAEAMILSRRLLAAATLVLAHTCTQAQSMQDPTRPPALPMGGNGAAEVPAGPRLQSVLISREPGGRNLAVIDGDTVRLGEMYKGARVAHIAPNRVELLRGKDRQVLTLPTGEEPGGVVKPAYPPK
jgi:MSHA biogenesis protein MshK